MIDTDLYYSVFSGEKPGSVRFPEKHLLSAVLRRAVIDYFGSDDEAALDAETWFFQRRPKTDAFSFSWVCEQLALNRDMLLQRLQEIKRGAATTPLNAHMV